MLDSFVSVTCSEIESGVPLVFFLSIMISAIVLTAISAGVSAPISKPMGVLTRRSDSSGTLSRRSLERIPLALDFLT